SNTEKAAAARSDIALPHLGNLERSISATFAGGFVFEPDLSRIERERVANKLIRLEQKKRDPSVRDARMHERFVPASPYSILTFADGSVRTCFVIDVGDRWGGGG